jgi:cysteine-rich repeat protein
MARLSPHWLAASLSLLLACGNGNNQAPGCGDGATDAGEQCDDGNIQSGDGCSSACQQEGACGDGTLNAGEACDDGNSAAGDGCSALCQVEPPAGVTPEQARALELVNGIRSAAGLPGMEMPSTLNLAAQNHAAFFVNNPGAYANNLSPHEEVDGFPGFTGVQFFNRTTAAGFAGAAFFEVMAFSDDPDSAVGLWLNSVFHRVPLIHPNAGLMGYGATSGGGRAADVIDFGSANAPDAGQVVLFPPPNANDAEPAFNVLSEGPNPPRPPGGGNITGPVISVAFPSGSNGNITVHEVRDASGALIDHTFVSPQTPGVGPFMSGSFALYADGPAESGERFSVHVEGTINGQAFTRDWSFTTR